MLRVGLTGGIACGKSHVLRRLAEEGVATLDLDAVVHELLAPTGAAYAEVVAAFGPGILDAGGRVDRKALGARVFADERAREQLNAIVHPKVRVAEARRAAAHAASGAKVFVTDAALLVETGMHLRFDRLVVVHCSPEEQVRRLVARDGLAPAEAEARLAAQMAIEEKRRFGHWQVDTSGTMAGTLAAAAALAAEIRAVAEVVPAPPLLLPAEKALGLLTHGPKRGARGLHPSALVTAIAERAGLDLPRLSSLLQPPDDGPWYRCGRAGEPGPESLAGVLVLWSLARGGPDPPFLVAAAASLAQLTHGDPASAAAAAFFALVLLAVAESPRPVAELADRLPLWQAQAEAWCGAAPPEAVVQVARLALTQGPDPRAAREAARAAGLDAGLAGAIVGLACGAPVEAAPEAARAAVKALRALSG